MVDIAAENQYITYMMNKLPNEKAKAEQHTLKKDECLWELAKKNVNDGKKASNAEISEYMLRIAKLNGLDTYEKMNNVKANTKLYMPEKSQKTMQSKTATEVRSSAEQSALNIISTLFNDKTLTVQRPMLGKNSTMYHVYNIPDKEYRKHVVMSFEMNDDGKLQKASFEDINQNINKIGYDYNLDKTGRIYTNKYNFNGQQKGRLTKEETQKLEQRLNELRKIATPIM